MGRSRLLTSLRRLAGGPFVAAALLVPPTGFDLSPLLGGVVPDRAAEVAAPHVAPAVRAAADAAPIPDGAELEAREAIVGRVHVKVKNIFDPELPGENHRLFRWANKVHRTTRPRVIRQQLLFEPGDPYSARRVAESERILRQNQYLYDVDIRPVRWDGRRVDLEIETRDVWTLSAGASFSRQGGANDTGFSIKDSNLLGTGKALKLSRTSDVDRTSNFLSYEDRHVAGSRYWLLLTYSDNSDGDSWTARLQRPFFSLETRRAGGFLARTNDRVDTLYRLGEVFEEFRHLEERYTLHAGLSEGLSRGRARRWTAGLTYERDRFYRGLPPGVDSRLPDPLQIGPPRPVDPGAPRDPDAGPGVGPVTPLRPPLPDDRLLAYPWIGLSSVEDSFTEEHDLDQIQRTEDLFLGRAWSLRLGMASTAWGSDREAALLDASGRIGFGPRPDQTLLLSAAGSGRVTPDGGEDLLLNASARYYWRNLGEHLFFATLDATLSEELDAEEQVLLGGDSGLRGYPLRYQSGRARALLTLEQRFYSRIHLFKLAYLGAAVFADAGRTWGGPGEADLGLLTDVGLGLRLSSSRSGLGNVVHLDVAFPLDGDGSIESVQWLVETKSSF